MQSQGRAIGGSQSYPGKDEKLKPFQKKHTYKQYEVRMKTRDKYEMLDKSSVLWRHIRILTLKNNMCVELKHVSYCSFRKPIVGY